MTNLSGSVGRSSASGSGGCDLKPYLKLPETDTSCSWHIPFDTNDPHGLTFNHSLGIVLYVEEL